MEINNINNPININNMVFTDNILKRFWNNIDKTSNFNGCWEWQLSKRKLHRILRNESWKNIDNNKYRNFEFRKVG